MNANFPKSDFPVLFSDRFKLVEIKDEHRNDIFELFGDDSVTQFYNITTLQRVEDADAIIDHFRTRFADKKGIRWGIAEPTNEAKILGTIGFNSIIPEHKAQLGYDLKSAQWKRGIITEVIDCVLNYAFNNLNINRVEAEVMPGNYASERVLEKNGFLKEGLFRDWMFWNNRHYDIYIYSILKSDREKK
jgi:ribosomal-protein-alanine N-acetyltransferase